MKLTLALGALVLSLSAFAETATYNVSGMHCGGCAKMIEDGVCSKLEGVKTCKGEVIDAEKKIGKVTIVTKDGIKIDQGKVSELLAKAGEGYTIMTDSPATATATKKAKK